MKWYVEKCYWKHCQKELPSQKKVLEDSMLAVEVTCLFTSSQVKYHKFPVERVAVRNSVTASSCSPQIGGEK